MRLFKRNKENVKSCCRSGSRAPGSIAETPKAAAGIQVLGSGCAKCAALEDAVRAALSELGTDAPIGHVTDFMQIAAYGVMTTPALVVDGKVVSCGRVLKKEEAKALIQAARK